MRSRVVLIISVVLAFSTVAPAHASLRYCLDLFTKREVAPPGFSRAHARDVARVGDQIRKRFPPRSYAYLFVGRSPTPLLAYFELLGLEAYALPLTEFRNTPNNPDWFRTGGEPGRPLSDADDARLFTHFGNYLPRDFAGKRLLVIDFAVFGFRLNAATLYLRENFGRLRPPVTIEPFGLHFATREMEALDCVPSANHEIRSQTRPLFRYMQLSRYDSFAKYGAFRLGVDPSPVNVNPDYETLKMNLRRRLGLK